MQNKGMTNTLHTIRIIVHSQQVLILSFTSYVLGFNPAMLVRMQLLCTSIFIARILQIIRVNNSQLPWYLFLYGIREWSIKNLNVRYEKIRKAYFFFPFIQVRVNSIFALVSYENTNMTSHLKNASCSSNRSENF